MKRKLDLLIVGLGLIAVLGVYSLISGMRVPTKENKTRVILSSLLLACSKYAAINPSFDPENVDWNFAIRQYFNENSLDLYRRDSGSFQDEWDGEILIIIDTKKIRVLSPGPDGVPFNDDDIAMGIDI